MKIKCPHCAKSLGGTAREGGVRVRLGITLIDDAGNVHGPCPYCRRDVTVATGGELLKSLIADPPRGRRRLAIRKASRPDEA